MNCAKAVWNNIVSPGLESIYEDIKSVVEIGANFLVDTVWNIVVTPFP